PWPANLRSRPHVARQVRAGVLPRAPRPRGPTPADGGAHTCLQTPLPRSIRTPAPRRLPCARLSAAARLHPLIADGCRLRRSRHEHSGGSREAPPGAPDPDSVPASNPASEPARIPADRPSTGSWSLPALLRIFRRISSFAPQLPSHSACGPREVRLYRSVAQAGGAANLSDLHLFHEPKHENRSLPLA